MNIIQPRYIKYEEIDTDKWDHCLANSPNALVYAQSWLLDKLCPVWDALVLGDYQYIMPLTFRRKYMFRFLSQPIYCQQLGIFPTPTPEVTRAFYAELLRRFPFAQIQLNAMNRPLPEMQAEVRYNLLLQLNENYNKLAGQYSEDILRKLKKTSHNRLSFVGGLSLADYLQFKKDTLAVKLSKTDLLKLHHLLAFSLSRNLGEVYGVYNRKNVLCAAAFFVRYQKRATLLDAADSAEGKELDAMLYLVDKFIHLHAEKDFTLGFDGSVAGGGLSLYKGLGGTPEPYYFLSWNNLPVWAKWFNKWNYTKFV